MKSILKSALILAAALGVLSCREEMEVTSSAVQDAPEPRTLVLIRDEPYMEKPYVQTIDLSGWEEGEDAVVLFDGQIDLVFTIPYPWHGEDTIIYSYDGEYLWVRTKPEDTTIYLRFQADDYEWLKRMSADTAHYYPQVLGRVVGFCQHRWEQMVIENPSDIVCIGNLNGIDFDSLKLYPDVEAIGIECVGYVGSYMPVQPRYLKKISKDIDLYVHCDIKNIDSRSLLRVKKNLKGLFAYVYPWAGKTLRRIGKMRNLRQLKLRFFTVNDDELKHLANLKNLHTLTLDGIKISDQGLAHLAKIRSLRSLTLEEFQPHTREDFRFWFENLTIFTCSSGEYSDRFDYVSFIEEFPYQYGSLFIPHTTAEGWRHLVELPYLRELYLGQYGLDLRNEDLEGIGSIVGLRRLELQGQCITDEGLRYLEGLKNLKELAIYSKSITWEGINRLQRALPECRIDHTLLLYQEIDDN